MPVEEIEEFVVELPTVGEKFKGKLVGIRKGKVKELIDIDGIRNEELRKRYERYADREAIELKIDTGAGTISRVIPISYRSNSRFYKLIKKYGKLKVGMDIGLIIHSNGRVRLVYD